MWKGKRRRGDFGGAARKVEGAAVVEGGKWSRGEDLLGLILRRREGCVRVFTALLWQAWLGKQCGGLNIMGECRYVWLCGLSSAWRGCAEGRGKRGKREGREEEGGGVCRTMRF